MQLHVKGIRENSVDASPEEREKAKEISCFCQLKQDLP